MLQEAVDFLTYLKNSKGASAHTLRNYCIDLNSLKDFVENKVLARKPEELLPPITLVEKLRIDCIPLSIFNRTTMRQYLAFLGERHQSARSILRKFSSIRSFFSFCLRQGSIQKHPLEGIANPKIPQSVPMILSYQELLRFFDTPDIQSFLGLRDRSMMELFYSSALRVSELVQLNREDLYLDELVIHVLGKGNKERRLPITQTAKEWILRYLNHPERIKGGEFHLPQRDPHALFLNCNGTRITVRSVDRKFDHYLKQSGLIEKITPHTIRHTIATHWLENGMDLKTIQTLLGHSNLATTTLYTQVSKGLKRKVYDSTHPRA